MLISSQDTFNFPLGGMPVLENILGDVTIRNKLILKYSSMIYSSFKAGAQPSYIDYTLPTALSGNNSRFLTNATTGALSWGQVDWSHLSGTFWTKSGNVIYPTSWNSDVLCVCYPQAVGVWFHVNDSISAGVHTQIGNLSGCADFRGVYGDRHRVFLGNDYTEPDLSRSSALHWYGYNNNSPYAGDTLQSKWEMGNDYDKLATQTFYLYDYLNAINTIKIDHSSGPFISFYPDGGSYEVCIGGGVAGYNFTNWGSMYLGGVAYFASTLQTIGLLTASGGITCASTFTTTSAIVGKITTKTSTPYTISTADETVIFNSPGGSSVINLPTATVGQIFTIKSIGLGTITLNGSGTDKIDGLRSFTMKRWESVTLQCYIANNWAIISRYYDNEINAICYEGDVVTNDEEVVYG